MVKAHLWRILALQSLSSLWFMSQRGGRRIKALVLIGLFLQMQQEHRGVAWSVTHKLKFQHVYCPVFGVLVESIMLQQLAELKRLTLLLWTCFTFYFKLFFLLQERDSSVNPILEHFSGEDPSMVEGQEQDSFRPLIGQLADQSSCLAADHREQLVCQPWAHSSMIGQLPGLPVSLSLDQGGWDSTLNRMIGRLSHQSSSHWLSGGQDFYAGQLMGQMPSEQSTTWLDEGPDESRMRPLVGELDESAGQHSGSSGRRRIVCGIRNVQ